MDSSESDTESISNQINEDMAAAVNNDQLHSQNWTINNLRSLNPHQNGSIKNQFDGDSDSDGNTGGLDNPNNLKKLCSGFVDTIKEKNDTINMYRRMVINSNLQLVRMDSAYQRKMRIYCKGSR